ncbi:MAG: N,N-dimethylformamidase beta subunit family domain-containing protein [Bacteroidota bacterium]
MRRRLLWTLGGITLLSIATLGLILLTHFYFLFPSGSHLLFKWQHRWVDHMEMHTDAWAYQAGDSIHVFVSNGRGEEVDVSLFDLMGRDTLYKGRHPALFQEVRDSVAIYGTDWEASFSIPLPSHISTGWYILQLSREAFSASTTLMVIPPKKPTKPIAWCLSTNTWNAYNHWGGFSIYTPNHTPTVSFHRPQLLADPFIQNTYANHQLFYQAANKDVYLATLLDSLNLDFDVYPMEALHEGWPQLSDYQTIMISTHSEYWSREMLNHLNSYLDSGASFVNLAGNVAAYRTFLDTQTQQMSVYRKVPELWEEQDTTSIRPFGTQARFLGFHTYAPYQVIVDTSWVWKGTNLSAGDIFGEKSETYDYTYMYASVWENILGLRNKGKMGAASGLEIDKVYEGTASNWITLASGLNPYVEGHGEVYPEKLPKSWTAGHGADLGYYIHPGGGLVFSVGSMAFTGAIPHDPPIQKIIENVLRKTLEVGEN